WWWGLWGLGHLLTGRTVRLVDEARKGLGVGGARAARRDGLGWLGLGRHAAAGPGEVQHDTQPQESQDHELIVKLLWNHGKKPPHNGMIGGHCTRFSGQDNYPQRRGTRPGVKAWRYLASISGLLGKSTRPSYVRRASTMGPLLSSRAMAMGWP